MHSQKNLWTVELGLETNNTTSWSTTGVTSLEGVWVTTLTEVIGTGVNDNGSTEDRSWTEQLDQVVSDGTLSDTRGIGLDVTQVTNVSGLIRWGTVGLAEWVEVWTGRGTTVGVVTKLVNVETTLSVRVVTSDFVGNSGWLVLGSLLEVNGTGDTGITTQDSNFMCVLVCILD